MAKLDGLESVLEFLKGLQPYQFNPDENLVEVILVGKRNDDEVYKKLKRL